MNSVAAAREHWERKVRALRLRLVIGAFLDRAALPVLALGIAACVIVLALRLLGYATPAQYVLALWLPLAFAWTFLRLRRVGLPSRAFARVLLEEQLGLNSALSAAEDGLAPWPEPKAISPRSTLRLTLQRWSSGPAVALLAVLLAAWLPVRTGGPESAQPQMKPPALATLEALTDELSRSEWVEPAAAQNLEQKVEELASQTPEGWFSHGSLEAAESLLANASDGLALTADALDAATRALEPLGTPSGMPGDASMLEAANRLTTALRGMDPSILPASDAMRRALEAAAKSPLSLSPEQMAKLMEAARRNASAARALSGTCQGVLQLRRETAEQAAARRAGAGRNGGEGDGPGAGGVSRGPGTAPVTLLADLSPQGAGAHEGVQGADLENAALGETLEQTPGRHKIDRASVPGVEAGGRVGATGGAEVVGTQELTPAERKLVESLFR